MSADDSRSEAGFRPWLWGEEPKRSAAQQRFRIEHSEPKFGPGGTAGPYTLLRIVKWRGDHPIWRARCRCGRECDLANYRQAAKQTHCIGCRPRGKRMFCDAAGTNLCPPCAERIKLTGRCKCGYSDCNCKRDNDGNQQQGSAATPPARS